MDRRTEDAPPVASTGAPEPSPDPADAAPPETPKASDPPPEAEANAEPSPALPVPAPTEAPPPDAAKEPGGGGEELSRLLADSAKNETKIVTPKKGARVSGKIVQIGEKGAFIDFGGREEGFLDLSELRDDKGEISHKAGDKIQATVVSVEGGTKLTRKGKRTGNLSAVLEAHRSGMTLDGRVTGVNKGGLVVRVLGVRAFCPFSQIDRRYVEDPSEYVGKRLSFRVTSADAKGKNIVLSRRALLEEEIRGHADTLRKELAVGQELSGVVARVRPFGAFVDLGGVDGLVHLSEISHVRVKDPSEILKVGQDVRVRVLKIEDLGGKKERISLSIKQLQEDPWDTMASQLEAGGKVTGRVARVVEFGAFLEIVPGVDGLIHVSAMAEGRVEHPSDVVKEGESLEAWVVSVDRASRRISLSLVDPAVAAPSDSPEGRRPPRRRSARESREVREYRESTRKPEGGLTSMEEAFRRLRERDESR